MKGRWRRLLKDKLEIDLKHVTPLVMTACALHNLCEQMRDSFLLEWTPESVNEGRITRRTTRQRQDEAEAGADVANVKQALTDAFLNQPIMQNSTGFDQN